MRTLIFDQYEFDHSSSEESLHISIASKGNHQFPDFSSFALYVLGKELAKKLPVAIEFDEHLHQGQIRYYLQRYSGVELPHPCNWLTYILANDWNDLEVLLEGPYTFIRYYWSTSA
jgi:hypothetical protein